MWFIWNRNRIRSPIPRKLLLHSEPNTCTTYILVNFLFYQPLISMWNKQKQWPWFHIVCPFVLVKHFWQKYEIYININVMKKNLFDNYWICLFSTYHNILRSTAWHHISMTFNQWHWTSETLRFNFVLKFIDLKTSS